MDLTVSEKATLYFYQWDYQYRGYYHFDSPIDIEIPYSSFYHGNYTQKPIVDDGRVPSLFKSISNLFLPKPKEIIEEEDKELLPTYIAAEDAPIYVGFSVSFQKGQNILPIANIEFLNMLSFTAYPVSFEILGTKEEIRVQFVCNELDKTRVASHLKAYFPTAILRDIDVESFGFDTKRDVAIADFGINDEFVRPIYSAESFAIDPLTSLIATMDSLQDNDVVVFQTIFKGITSPLAKDIPYAVSDGQGGSFFGDAPEMPKCAEDKISNPLFSVVIRIATQGTTNNRSQYLAQELARSITTVSTSRYNKLIPLSNEGYDYGFHLLNLHHRLSNRLGFILNSKELNTFIHYPNNTVVSSKIGLQGRKTKRQKSTEQTGIYLGENIYQGESYSVHLDTETRLSHTHIIGTTGVGKSTLIANMMLADIKKGRGCAIFDPHGDICDDILKRIPANRKDDVIIIDPSDSEFPIGFNLLEAHTEAEKIVLSSDLVSAFKRHATAWGDNMTAVLQNAVNTILESSRGGTLIELKRFLIEEKFRNEYLSSVDDPSLHYYWQNEYPMVRKGIAPLLTRIDTFLRPKLVRYMLAQKKGVDIADCLNNNKIVLLKLSQGLIGEQNSYLLGSLFLAKFNQAALSRQSKKRDDRTPYMLYLDEFQNFITPSIERILSGARKYALGITIAHQELGQVQDTSLLNSVLSNPKTRICFRLGDNDAKKLESGFSYFEQSDLQSLERGEAIIRIGSNSNDFNITTNTLEDVTTDYSHDIITSVRENYGTPKAEIEELLISLLPNIGKQKITPKKRLIFEEKKKEVTIDRVEIPLPSKDSKVTESNIITGDKRAELVKVDEISQNIKEHRYIQSLIQRLGQERGYLATIEKEISLGKRIDVVLEQGHIKIAFEISVTNTVDYEVGNIKKCFKEGCAPIVMVSNNKKHLQKIEKKTKEELSAKDYNKTFYISSNDISTILDSIQIKPTKNSEIIKGFRITTEYQKDNKNEGKSIRERIAKLLSKKR